MKIVIVEFLWHANKIISNKETFRRDIIVSLDPESSFLFRANNIKYFESYEFCNHKKIWERYKELTDRTVEITKVMDEALWQTDKRFKDLNWKLFYDFYFSIKILFDQLFYYSELVSNLIDRFNPTEIIVADNKKIIINDYFLVISSEISVIKHLLNTIKDDSKKIKFSFVSPDKETQKKIPIIRNFKNSLKNRIKNIYLKINFLFRMYTSKPKCLAIGCAEIIRHKKLFPEDSKLYLVYLHENLSKQPKINENFYRNFIYHLKKKSNYLDLIKHKNISFELIFDQILLNFTKKIELLIKEYKNAKKIIKYIRPLTVIFQSTAPFYLPNIVFRKNCIDFNIPYMTWSHGGCGLTHSISPYDATDFRFCKNHISYGPYLKHLVEDEKCILNKLELSNNQKIFPVGSSKLEFDNLNINLKKGIKKDNNKKTILFLMGFNYERNHFYFGRNREKWETLLWEFNYNVLRILKKYQNKYNIIFKDYPNGRKGLWTSILKNINANEILYISDEYKVRDLLNVSDLNILPWISTTFFEALHFDADIFLIEEDMFKKNLEKNLLDEIYYFEESDKFKLNLEKYLIEGNFFRKKKSFSRKYFLNLDNFKKKSSLLKEAIYSVSNY